MGKSPPIRLRKGEWLPAIGMPLLLVLASLLFWPAIHGPFLFDDYSNLQNLALLGSQPDLAAAGRYLHAFVGNPGRPLGALSFLIDDRWHEVAKGGFVRAAGGVVHDFRNDSDEREAGKPSKQDAS